MSSISATSVAKLGIGYNVNTDVLIRICGTNYVMELVREARKFLEGHNVSLCFATIIASSIIR